jgi:hypothetical protein
MNGIARTVYLLYMTVYLVIPLPNIPFINRIYVVLTDPTNGRYQVPGA